jgi:CRISPR-associated protein Csh2
MTTQNIPQLPKSEILFLYESKYSLPNGDPFTGEQRYDGETKKILVSDVRIKRFIRDYIDTRYKGQHKIFVKPAKSEESEKSAENKDSKKAAESGASQRFQELKRDSSHSDNRDILLECLDARLFGAVVTIKTDSKKKKSGEDGEKADKAFNLTGPVQFALLNPSLNSVDLRAHQNTSRFVSKVGKEQGAIATTTLVPYALNQIHGWINPYSADETGLTQQDIDLMFSALWHSVNNANTRSKSNQDSLLLLQIVYREPHRKIYGIDRLIEITKEGREKQEEQFRSIDDYTLNFSKLQEKTASDVVEKVYYYTEHNELQQQFASLGDKFQLMKLETL